MSSITKVSAREILDSRGNPTLEVELELSDGVAGIASVPSGASRGRHEALELRDSDPQRFHGLGVLKAVENVSGPIAKSIIGMELDSQEGIDRRLIALDGTEDKSRLGANAILGVSLAFSRAMAKSKGLPLYVYLGNQEEYLLPVPMLNILNGGKHASNSTDFQEFMIVPAGAGSLAGAIRMAAEIYQSLRSILKRRDESTNVGDEGGFAPAGYDTAMAIEVILQAIDESGYKPGEDCFIAIDAAASEFYTAGVYSLSREGKKLSSEEMVGYYAELTRKYPIISLEDGLAEDDWDGWQILNQKLGERIRLVGDDLYVTNVKRIEKGIKLGASNAVLIKPNQIGTLTETIAAVNLAKKAGWRAILSHRSGETEDTILADLAVGLSTGIIKAGAPCRSERTAKYNRLLKIECELGGKAKFPAREAF
jgi:enolase